MTVDFTIPGVLRQTADLLRVEGWMAGTMHRPNCGYCLIGAIGAVVNGGPPEGAFAPESLGELGDKAVVALVEFLDEHAEVYDFHADEYDVRSYPIEAVIDWNDNQAEDREQVVRMLTAAAESWEWATSHA
jgi:hypothetical protein